MEILLTILLILIVVNWNTIKCMFSGVGRGKNAAPQTDETLTDNTQSNNGERIMDYSADEKYSHTVVSSSPFQDSLKSAARTAAEVTEEKQNINHNKIKNDVEATIERIHNDILLSANQGQYTEKDGKRIVSVLCYIPFEYCIKTEIAPIYAKQYNGIFAGNAPAIDDIDSYTKAMQQLSPQERRKCRLVQQTPKKTVFKASPDFDTFISLLRKKAGYDGITISPVIIEHKRLEDTKTEHTFPATLIGNLNFTNVSFMARCECCIPEKYSTDIPIEIDMPPVEVIPAEAIETTASKSTISIDAMEGHQFEAFCADVLSKNGYMDVEVTRGSGDQGIDIIAYKDGVKFGIQCKCYSSDVGNKAVQEAFSGKTYYKCHVGVVLTNRYFTRSAIELSKSNGILLWDRGTLLNMIRRAGIKIDG